MFHTASKKFILCVFVVLLLPLALVALAVFSQSSPTAHTSALSSSSATSDVEGSGGVHVQVPGDGPVIITPTPPAGIAAAPSGCQFAVNPPTAFSVLWPSLGPQLTSKYRNLGYALLCMDTWSSTWKTATCTLSMQTIFKSLGWPQDLLKKPYGTYVECVGPLTTDEIEALKAPSLASTSTQTSSTITGNCVWDLGNWVVAHPVIQICDLINGMFKGVLAQPLQTAFQQVNGQVGSFLWTTPASMTYNNPVLLKFWTISMGIVTLWLVVALAWASLRSMVRTTNWLSYANVVELLPRILFGVLAAYGSLEVARLTIDTSNALSTIFVSDLFTKLTQSSSDNIIVTVLQALDIIMAIGLVLEEAVRFVMLYILIGFAPLWAFSMSLRETQGIARAGFQGLIIFALLQPAQNAILDLGGDVVSTLTGSPLNYGVMQFLIVLGIMFLALSLIFVASRAALGGMAIPLAALTLGTMAFTGRSILRYGARNLPLGQSARTRTAGGGTPSRTPIQRTSSLAGRLGGRAVRATVPPVGWAIGNAASTIARAPGEFFDALSGRPQFKKTMLTVPNGIKNGKRATTQKTVYMPTRPINKLKKNHRP